MIPGRTLHRLAGRICTTKTLERVVEPAIADLQKEYAGITAAARVLRARTLLRGYVSLLKVLVICALSGQTDTEEERNMLAQTFAWSVVFVVASSALLILPPLYHWGDALRGWYVVMTLVPQAVPLAIPIGIAFGIALGGSGRTAFRASTALLLCVATAASLLSFAVLGWVMPAGNQAFREAAFRQVIKPGYQGPVTLRKGHNEMTFSELRREVTVLSASDQPREARQFSFVFHLRFSLAAAALALASVLLAVGATHRGLRASIALASCVAYWMILYAGEEATLRGYLPVPVGAWLPNLMLMSLAIFVSSCLRGSSLRGQKGVAQ